MKNLMNLSIALLVLTFLTTVMFAQSNPNGKGLRGQNAQSQWIDTNGDGVCDNFGTANQGNKNAVNGKKGNSGQRLGDGSGVRPQDGTSFGKGNRTGDCDETCPKGSRNRSTK